LLEEILGLLSVPGVSGAAMVPLGFPIRYTRSPVECASLKDVEEMVRLLESLILEMDQGGWDAEKA